MIETYLRNFIIKTLLCILSPPILERLKVDTQTTNAPVNKYTISKFLKQSNKLKFIL